MTDTKDELTRLREQVAWLERDNEQLSRELVEMERLDRRLLRQHGPDTYVLRQVLGVIEGRLPGAITAVAIADTEGQPLRVAIAHGLTEEAIGIRLEANSGPVGQTLRGGSPRSFPARRFHLDETMLEEVDSVTLVPMRLPGTSHPVHEQEGAAGVILVATTATTQLLGGDLEFLRRVGVHAAVLLENSQLLDTLQRSEETYRTMVEQAHLGMALLERDGLVGQTNEPMRELLGVDAAGVRPFIDYIAEEDQADIESRLEYDETAGPSPSRLLSPTEVTMLGSTGARRVRLSVTPIRERHERITGHVVIARDVTEEVALATKTEAMARRVQQAEKLSAVGQFVAGIAHELNNPLTVVIGYAELLEAEESLDPRLAALVDQVLQHAQRCGRIVADLLTFSRQEQRHPEPVWLADVVHEALAATRHKVRPNDVVST
ncbi:MAG: histidine kinase dimerization/phospho-acceptor domain-containing protein, partial [Myxococcota bacterium]|nr:histidine kinase dimerization/phospho-acceptor domain-containing protein [Myxococcota bacterium]